MPTDTLLHILDGLDKKRDELPFLVLPDDAETVALYFLPEPRAELPS